MTKTDEVKPAGLEKKSGGEKTIEGVMGVAAATPLEDQGENMFLESSVAKLWFSTLIYHNSYCISFSRSP